MAAKNTLEMVFKVKDDGTVVITKASKKINKSLKGIEKTSTKATKSMAAGWKKLGSIMLAAFAFDKMISGLQSVVTAASDLQEVTSKFETVFGDNMDIASGYVDELTSSYYLSTRAAREYLASTQDLLVPMGVAATQAANLSGEVVKLASDLGSFNNVGTAKVMADMQSALVGNFETMKKYGVVLNEARIKQKAFAMGLITTIKSAIDPAAKALAAYQLMVEGSTAAIGDSIRTANSYANLLKSLKATIENVAGSLGASLLHYLSDLIADTTDWIKANEELIALKFEEYVDKLAKSVKFLAKHLDTILNIFKALVLIKVASWIIGITTAIKGLILTIAGGTVVQYLLGGAIPGGGVSTLSFFKRLGVLLKSIFVAAGRFAVQFIPGIIAFMSNPFVLGFAAVVTAIGAAMYLQAGKTRKAKEALEEYTEAIKAMKAVDLRITISDITDQIVNQQKIIDDYQKKLKVSMDAGATGRGLMGFGSMAQDAKSAEEAISKLIIKQNLAKDLLFKLTKKPDDPDKPKISKELETVIMPQVKKETFDEQVARILEIEKLEKEAHDANLKRYQDNFNAFGEYLDDKHDALDAAAKAEQDIKDKNDQYWKDKIKSMGEATAAYLAVIKTDWDNTVAEMYNLASTGMTDQLFEYRDGIKSANRAWKDFADSYLREIAKMIIQQSILKSLEFVGGGIGGAAGAVMGLFGFAKGGNVQGGTPIIVGEKGPEIFNPSSNGSIIPNDKLGSSQITNINVNVEANGRSPDEAKREGDIIGESVRQAIRQQIQYEQKANGLLNRQPAF